LFAGLAEALGRSELDLFDHDAPATVGALESRLREAHAALAGRPFRVAATQSNRSTPRAIPSSRSAGKPTPIR